MLLCVSLCVLKLMCAYDMFKVSPIYKKQPVQLLRKDVALHESEDMYEYAADNMIMIRY